MNISLLLVTYNRIELLKKALYNISINAGDIDEIIIVDNFSSDGTFDFLKEEFKLFESEEKFTSCVANADVYKGCYNDKLVTLIRLDNNTGGSGGFYTGLKYFRDFSKSEWVWGMDDDAFIQPNALDELKKGILENNNCNVFWSNCNNDKAFNANNKIVNEWMFVGFCLNKSVINKVGLPVSDYFIYHDDSEYAMRINRSGYDILKLRDSIIEHGDFSNREFFSKKFFKFDVKFPLMSDWKLYYYIRNDIHKHSYSFPSKVIRMLRLLVNIIKLIYIEPSKGILALKAWGHGLLGIKGKIVSP
ncbi:TPA: glycosyltransferase [Photobacterium damselae]